MLARTFIPLLPDDWAANLLFLNAFLRQEYFTKCHSSKTRCGWSLLEIILKILFDDFALISLLKKSLARGMSSLQVAEKINCPPSVRLSYSVNATRSKTRSCSSSEPANQSGGTRPDLVSLTLSWAQVWETTKGCKYCCRKS